MLLLESNHKLSVDFRLESIYQIIPAFDNTWILIIERIDHTRIVHIDSKGL
jgi:hypothetical protein